MAKFQAQWHTPIAVQKHREKIYEKLEKCEIDKNVDLTKEHNYFNNPKTYKPQTQYDLFFSYTKMFPLWDQRKNRENRRYLPDIHENIFRQDKDKPVPALTSHNYGRPCRPFYDFLDRTHNRQDQIATFYRRKGGVIKSEEREPH